MSSRIVTCIQNPSVYRYQQADFNPAMKTIRGHTPFRGEQLNIKGKSDLKEVLDIGLVSCRLFYPRYPSGFFLPKFEFRPLDKTFAFLFKRLVAGPALNNW